VTFPPTRLNDLARCKRKQAHNLLKEFCTAEISVSARAGTPPSLHSSCKHLTAPCPRAARSGTSPPTRASLKSICLQAEAASIGLCLRLVSSILGWQSFAGALPRAEGALDEMFAKIAFYCCRMLQEVLPRLPALAAALAGRRSLPGELIKSVVDLLAAYGRADSQESVTPTNLDSWRARSPPLPVPAGALQSCTPARWGSASLLSHMTPPRGTAARSTTPLHGRGGLRASARTAPSPIRSRSSQPSCPSSAAPPPPEGTVLSVRKCLLNHTANLSSYFGQFTACLIHCFGSCALSTLAGSFLQAALAKTLLNGS
jgi:hypothetical protein